MLRLHNTMSRRIDAVEPVDPPLVKIYSCGPTVYRYVHVGNLRTFLLADLIRRAFTYMGTPTKTVMNITDVGHMTDEVFDAGEDKMLLAAQDEGKTPEEIAAFYIDAFFRDIDTVNIRRADAYPKASDHIPQMIEVISKLIERGHAYEDGGTVYYDVTSFPAYGRLSGQSIDDVRAGHRIANIDHHKRHHQDFVLWKAAGPRRVVVFDSPWGRGYPGWHIECSAMSMHYLGDRFDVHTGGEDLRFPHHEGEIAQSEGAVGHEVVRTWVHGHHLLMGQAKMAKSAGNVFTIGDVAAAGHDPLAFRYLCFTARYRRQVGFTPEALDACRTTLRRLRERIEGLAEVPVTSETDAALRGAVRDDGALRHHHRFVAALCEDLDLPEGLKALHDMLSDADVPPAARAALAASWDEVLGLDLVRTAGDLPEAVDALLRAREQARAERDFVRADALRDQIREAGYDLVDTPAGTRWHRVS